MYYILIEKKVEVISNTIIFQLLFEKIWQKVLKMMFDIMDSCNISVRQSLCLES